MSHVGDVTLSSFVLLAGKLHEHFCGFMQITEQAWEGEGGFGEAEEEEGG